MSVTERIRQIQAEREERKARETAARIAAQKKLEKERITAEKAAMRAEELRRQEIISKTSIILEETGISEMLHQIEKDFFGKGKPACHISTDYSTEDGKTTIEFSWNHGKYNNNGYDYFEVTVYTDKNTLEIGRDTFLKKDFKKRLKIEESIAQAFSSYNHHEDEYYEKDYGGDLGGGR